MALATEVKEHPSIGGDAGGEFAHDSRIGCRYGLVTVDVEPDNVWANPRSISLENIRFLPRFQSLCSEYGIRPTYLITYSVAAEPDAAQIIERLYTTGECEIGAHSHLWEIPPSMPTKSEIASVGNMLHTGILYDKLETLTSALVMRFGKVSSHRAGRWGFDVRQARILTELGYLVDSSVAPGLDWSITGAPDYSMAPMHPYWLLSDCAVAPSFQGLLEVPCTVRPGIKLLGLERTRYGRAALSRLGLSPRWLRCFPQVSEQYLISICEWAVQRLPHLNIMTHSSELCPGTSPMWKTGADIERHFRYYSAIFSWWRTHEVMPVTLREFAPFWSSHVDSNCQPPCPAKTGFQIGIYK